MYVAMGTLEKGFELLLGYSGKAGSNVSHNFKREDHLDGVHRNAPTVTSRPYGPRCKADSYPFSGKLNQKLTEFMDMLLNSVIRLKDAETRTLVEHGRSP